MKRIAAVVALAALTATAASAQSIPAAAPSTPAAERGAVAYVVQDSVGDVQLARLALTKTQSSAVRAFAQRMISDHTRSADEGYALGKRIGAEDAQLKPSDEGQIELAHFARYNGARFDREYMKDAVTSHEHDISTVQDALEASTTPEVTQFERSTIAMMQTHLALAKQTLAGLGSGG